jgi:phage baseplate assembly protein W
MAKPLYRGFSTAAYRTTGQPGLVLTNQALVIRDLLNHINTVPGERPHLPSFGTRIPLLAFEPMDSTTVGIVREDLKKAVDYDPRLRLLDMSVQALPDNHAIVAYLDVLYVELGGRETLKLEFAVGG